MKMRIQCGLLGAAVILSITTPSVTAVQAGHSRQTTDDKAAKKVERALSEGETKEEYKALRRFQGKLADYAALHFMVKWKIVPLAQRGSPQAFAAAIAGQRKEARQGDVFVTEVQPLLRRLIVAELQGAGGLSARDAIAEEDEDPGPVIPEVVVRVNARFPSGAVRSTVPVGVLRALPPLPDCLRYRFVRGDLILVDTVAQTVVDYLTGVVPEVP